ncbi:MAG: ABC transporter ATP-binding protein [Acidobacteriota bacterium]|nr:ABC transporter ATP-binding protein [Acidobacteriota bacterium]
MLQPIVAFATVLAVSDNRLLVEARGLTKTYPARNGTPPFRAVDGIDFAFGRGEAFGFLGPNGAGKSSTMRMLAATSPVTAGSLRVLGLDPARDGPEIRSRIGVVPQDDCLDRELTVRENIYVYGRYFGLAKDVIRERLEALLQFAQLEDKADAQVEMLSGGMRRRLTIARSLINEPEILLLDEPTTGLDPQARHVLWDRLYRLKADGVTLIITTHYMDEAEQLCDRLAVMDAGRIVAEGSPRELIESHVTREVLELRFANGAQAGVAEQLRVASLGERVELLPDRVVVYADDGEAALGAVHAAGAQPITALVRRATLEDVFLKLTGRSLID